MGRQSEREGGQFLILSPKEGLAAALSALPSEMSESIGSEIPEVNNDRSERNMHIAARTESKDDILARIVTNIMGAGPF
ncbi:MAG: hypothetical protein ACI3ZK_08460 [Candidatus Cryptobacteroides sp.]